jgi:hypothetical protein
MWKQRLHRKSQMTSVIAQMHEVVERLLIDMDATELKEHLGRTQQPLP